MTHAQITIKKLLRENEKLRARLEEAEEVLRAIRNGDVDTLVIPGPPNDKIFTLEGADYPYRLLIETMNEGAATLISEGTILFCNKRLSSILNRDPHEIIGNELRSFVASSDLRKFDQLLEKGLQGNCKKEIHLLAKGGKSVPTLLSLHAFPVNGIPGVSAIVTDISERKKSEEKLKKTLDDSDRRVRVRTEELSKLNKDLLLENEERKQVERALKQRENELEIGAQRLAETNIALNVLLKKKEEDKAEIEEKVFFNIEQLITPYLVKIKRGGLDEKQKTYISILESNLKEIISPVSHRLSSIHLKLTPSEIRIVNLLKQEKTNKEISQLLNLSQRTIAFHRENIRKKFKIVNKKTNLKSFLQTLK